MFENRFDAYDRFDPSVAPHRRREELESRRAAARRLRGDARALMSGPEVDAPPIAVRPRVLVRVLHAIWLRRGPVKP